jgi:phosphoribosylanthranilate isomerase
MTLVKICGITNIEDARVAVAAGADLLGFIFYPQSPRYVPPERVCEIVSDLCAETGGVTPRLVGVFVDAAPEAVLRTRRKCGLHLVQLHGSEPPQAVEDLMATGTGVIKAFRVRDAGSLSAMARYRPTAFLLDTYVGGQPGGTGRTFNWELALEAKRYGPVVLAGGLTPENVAQAVRQVRPWAVDVSSGVEASPGRKDHDRVYRFVANVRSSDSSRSLVQKSD